jgi:hypothetical protein
LQPTQLNITNDPTQRYGEPEVAVNPTNPNNLVYFVMSNRTTYACEASGISLCAPGDFILAQPLGFWAVPGWYSNKLFVSFDRGRSWQQESFPTIPAFRGFPGEGTDHSDLLTRPDPMVTVTADGTFYIGWDAIHTCVPGTGGCVGTVDAGIAVSKSPDGGRTWSTPVLTGTGVDRPWMTTDLSTGTVYDRWVVSSPDGVNWTAPHELGGGGFSGAGGATISAAGGELTAGFRATTSAACSFFLGNAAAPCTVFETSKDSGATWSRHPVPAPANSTGSVLVAADPAQAGTFTVAVLDSTSSTFQVFVTHDNGNSWSGPATLTDNPNTIKFKTWINYSPTGVLGLAWRSATTDPPAAADATVAVRSVLAAATDEPPCDSGIFCGNDENDTDPTPVPYTMQAAISNDQGATWSAPLQISTAPSPASDPLWATGGDRDDTSVIALSRQDAFVGWGDWRPGDVQGFFSAIKLQAFSFHQH